MPRRDSAKVGKPPRAGSRGERKISIQVGSEKATAVLLDKQAPKTCEAVWRLLPYETDAHHSRVCSNEIIFMMPAMVDAENPTVPKVGDIGYWTVRQCVNIWYDTMTPLGPTNLFARIVENLEGFRTEAKKVWGSPGGTVRVERVR